MSIAGIAGLPQITVPAGEVDGCPIGLWLVGPSHSDERLLELGRAGQRAGCWGVAPK
jgi:amidase